MNTLKNQLAGFGIGLLSAVATLLSWIIVPLIAVVIIVGYGAVRLGLAVRTAVTGRGWTESASRPIVVRETLAPAA